MRAVPHTEQWPGAKPCAAIDTSYTTARDYVWDTRLRQKARAIECRLTHSDRHHQQSRYHNLKRRTRAERTAKSLTFLWTQLLSSKMKNNCSHPESHSLCLMPIPALYMPFLWTEITFLWLNLSLRSKAVFSLLEKSLTNKMYIRISV